jgi:peptide/nickel transport system ATP-binding protein
MTAPVLEISDLHVMAARRGRDVTILDGVSLSIDSGETVAVVGESGAGKTMCALAVMGLLPDHVRITQGNIRVAGDELVGAPSAAVRAKRGAQMAMVFQDPLSSLHPSFRVGAQIAEALRAHNGSVSKTVAATRAVQLLDLVGVPQPDERARAFPHQLSGGLRQRVMIAMAIANDPQLLIADEATTALDVTVQAQVLDVLRDAQRRTGAALLVVTHDLGVVAGVADVLTSPAHPYTERLLAAVPRRDGGTWSVLSPIPGVPPSPGAWPPGCAFHPRCERADDRCARDLPVLDPVPAGEPHRVACHHPVSAP